MGLEYLWYSAPLLFVVLVGALAYLRIIFACPSCRKVLLSIKCTDDCKMAVVEPIPEADTIPIVTITEPSSGSETRKFNYPDDIDLLKIESDMLDKCEAEIMELTEEINELEESVSRKGIEAKMQNMNLQMKNICVDAIQKLDAKWKDSLASSIDILRANGWTGEIYTSPDVKNVLISEFLADIDKLTNKEMKNVQYMIAQPGTSVNLFRNNQNPTQFQQLPRGSEPVASGSTGEKPATETSESASAIGPSSHDMSLLKLEDRVVMLAENDADPKIGTVKWIGQSSKPGELPMAGIEFDDQIGYEQQAIDEVKKCFECKEGHGGFIPFSGLILLKDFFGSQGQEQRKDGQPLEMEALSDLGENPLDNPQVNEPCGSDNSVSMTDEKKKKYNRLTQFTSTIQRALSPKSKATSTAEKQD